MRPPTPLTGPLARVPEAVAFAGDWHANLDWAIHASEWAKSDGAEVLLHAGDFGWLYEPDFLAPLSDKLRRLNLPILFVDGNHEDHKHLNDLTVDKGTRLRRVSDMIWHIPRATKWSWDGLRFMGLGGAVSIDRMNRVEGASWWPQEQLSLYDGRRARRAGGVDIMITHDCPAGVAVPGLITPVPANWVPMLPAAKRHRERLRSIVNVVKPKLLVHGHYHQAYSKRILSGWRGSGTVVHEYDVWGLARDGTNLDQNIVVHPLDYLKGNYGA